MPNTFLEGRSGRLLSLDGANDDWVASRGQGISNLPSAFPWNRGQLDITLGYQSGVIVARPVNPASLIPAAVWAAPVATQIFHVDPVNGNDANTGIGAYIGDFSNALKTLGTPTTGAIAKANTTGVASRIIVKCDSNPWFTRATGPATTFRTVDLSIEAFGGRGIFTGSDAHTWALDGTFTTCYSATESNCTGVVDIANTRWLGEAQGARLLDRSGVGRQAFVEMVKYATPTALNAATLTGSGGGYVNSGGKTYIKRGDGAAVTDLNSRSIRGTSTIAPAFSDGATSLSKSLYLTGFDMHGGFLSTAAGTRNVWLDNCRFMFANLDQGVAGNGAATDFIGTALLTRCESYCNGSDAYNPHGLNGAHQMALFDCLGWDVGRYTSQSNNGITGHETNVLFDYNGDYQLTRGAQRFIDNSRAFLVRTKSTGDLGDIAGTATGLTGAGALPPTALMADSNAIVWAIGCNLSSSDRATFTVGSAVIYEQGNTYSGSKLGNVLPLVV